MTEAGTNLDPADRTIIAADAATPAPDFDAVDHALDLLATTDPLLVHPDALPDGLQRLQRIVNRAGTLKARWATAAQQREVGGSRGTAKWMANNLGVDHTTAAKELDAGKAAAELPAVARAAEAGEISPDHARVIAKAVDRVEPERRQQAAETLVAVAKNNTPRETARQGRLRNMKEAPDKGLSTAQLQQDKRWLDLKELPDGMFEPKGRLTPEAANLFKAGLEPFLTPDPPARGSRHPASARGVQLPARDAGFEPKPALSAGS